MPSTVNDSVLEERKVLCFGGKKNGAKKKMRDPTCEQTWALCRILTGALCRRGRERAASDFHTLARVLIWILFSGKVRFENGTPCSRLRLSPLRCGNKCVTASRKFPVFDMHSQCKSSKENEFRGNLFNGCLQRRS